MAGRFELIRSATPARLYALAGVGVLSLLASVVVVRSVCGAFSVAISSPAYATCLIVASLFGCSFKLAAEWPPHRLSHADSLVFGTLISLPLVAIAAAFLLPGVTLLGVVMTVAWLALVGWFCLSTVSVEWQRWICGDIVWPELERFLCPLGQPAHNRPESPQFRTVSRESLISLAREPVLNDQPADDEVEGELVSQLQRRYAEMGADLLEGQLVATFEAGSRQSVLHVPFSPPFAAAPHVDCEVADGSDVRIKVGAVFTYGVRLELKRNSPELPELNVSVEIYAELAESDTPAKVALS